jgi:hypothetical protein
VITKRTDELRPGDRIRTAYGERTVKSKRPSGAPHHKWGTVFVEYESRPLIPGPYGAYADPDDAWQVVEPSKIDLAVERAYELADRYEQRPQTISAASPAIHLAELLDLFRAAR